MSSSLLVSSHWLLLVLASQMSMLADLSVMTARRSPSLSQPKQQHIPGSRTCSTISACRLYTLTHWSYPVVAR